jgi:hypothetical protein
MAEKNPQAESHLAPLVSLAPGQRWMYRTRISGHEAVSRGDLHAMLSRTTPPGSLRDS